jgi:SAM-dependent methyltransferase
MLLGQYPKIGSVSDDRFKEAERYRDTYTTFGNKPINDAICFEFGAGYDLFMTMCLASFGFQKIYSVDRVNWALPMALNFSAEHTKKRTGYPPFLPPPPPFDTKNYKRILLEYYHIDFHAPADARNTGLPDASVDYVFSNAVLEHIPENIIKEILKECMRLLVPDGILAFTIDYRDHCRDKNKISPYYFFRFSNQDWKTMYPPDGHNRLRHKDFRTLFGDVGFEILKEEAVSPFDHEFSYQGHSRDKLIEQLKSTPLAPEFQKYTLEELAVLSGFWVLRKKR